jgi:hypothetical protein
MSLDTAAIRNDFELLRHARESQPRSPWRRWLSWRGVEWAARWVLGMAPVAVAVGIMEYSYIGHDHGWPGIRQRVAGLAYAACVGWSILCSPGVGKRNRRAGLLLAGIAMGVFVGVIGPAIGIAPVVAGQSPGVILALLSGSILDALKMLLLLIWMAGPVSVALISGADALHSWRVHRGRGLRWSDAGWMLCGVFSGLIPAMFSDVWPMHVES